MIKDVHINNPELPFQGGSNSESIRLNRAGRSRITKILKPVATGKVRMIVIAREVGDSVLYHLLLGLVSPQQVSRGYLGEIRANRSNDLYAKGIP